MEPPLEQQVGAQEARQQHEQDSRAARRRAQRSRQQQRRQRRPSRLSISEDSEGITFRGSRVADGDAKLYGAVFPLVPLFMAPLALAGLSMPSVALGGMIAGCVLYVLWLVSLWHVRVEWTLRIEDSAFRFRAGRTPIDWLRPFFQPNAIGRVWELDPRVYPHMPAAHLRIGVDWWRCLMVDLSAEELKIAGRLVELVESRRPR